MDYTPQEEVVDYFNATVGLFQTLPTYDVFLSHLAFVVSGLIYVQTLFDAGIKPSDTQTYSFSSIQNALDAAHRSKVIVRCRNGALNEIRYYFNVAGSVRSGNFVPSTPCMLKTLECEH